MRKQCKYGSDNPICVSRWSFRIFPTAAQTDFAPFAESLAKAARSNASS